MSIGLAIYGCGTVGSGLLEILAARADELAGSGLALLPRHFVIRDPVRPRRVPIDARLVTTDHERPLSDPDVAIVVEVMGGIEPAGRVVCAALRTGRDVVTANKALIAARGAELEALAHRHGTALRYEAAVGGAIPVLRALRCAVAADRITRIRAVVNGTTNFILSRMAERGVPLAEALAEAQARGFAEADPTADLAGTDAAQKLIILARHAFGRWCAPDSVAREGIEHVTPADLDDACRRGTRIKLVAEAVLQDEGEIALGVGPRALPTTHPLAGAHDEDNVILLEGGFAGPLLFAGYGAGARPTGSAVFADLADIADRRLRRRRDRDGERKD